MSPVKFLTMVLQMLMSVLGQAPLVAVQVVAHAKSTPHFELANVFAVSRNGTDWNFEFYNQASLH